MPRTKTLKPPRPSSGGGRPGRSVPLNGGGPRRKRPLSRVEILNVVSLPAALLLAPALTLLFWGAARDWALDALGYGLVPVALYLVAAALVLRHRRAWLRPYWRVWVGAAFLVTVALSIMSMVEGAGWVAVDASLGGNWGQNLGGTPLALGAVKVAAIVIAGSLVMFPRKASAFYREGFQRALLGTALAYHWLAPRVARSVKALATRPTKPAPAPSAEAVFEVPASSTPATLESLDAETAELEEPEDKSAGKGKGRKGQGWQLPSIELLSKGESRPVSEAVLQQMAQHIEATLGEHRVEVAVNDVRTGPRIIRFGLVPGWVKKYREARGVRSKPDDDPGMEMSRVKVQSILMREKDLALALKTPYIRMEAPVPGESLVGLEVPNPHPSTVVLRSVAESAAFQKIAAKGGLPVALGEDTGGEPISGDLSDLPHLLIAGATGSGKSVCINTVVASLLLTKGPDTLRMIMVDPKRVELTPFNGIPHLVTPVIVDTDEVLVVLRGVQGEMLRRYKLMEESGARNIEVYNKKASEPLPFLVIIIDELADLMMAAAYEVEQGLVRLAQLGRATGIHLILATQRPSVNVVTGLLKANVPARIAFAVVSQVDSRVILDSVGAERLLGKGDMLLLSSDSPKPRRVQGTLVRDREIEKLVEFWQAQSGPRLPQISLEDQGYSGVDDDEDEDEELVDRARELAERFPQISPSVLQRRLQIGHSKAVRLMAQLEDEGVIIHSGNRR